jgi:hypothetical protein
MLADAFGTLFQRVGDAAPGKKRSKKSASPSTEATIDLQGKVRWGNWNAHFAQLANPTSFACDGVTLGVTISTSHHVYLISRHGNGS